MRKGPGPKNRKNEVNCAPSVPPPEALYHSNLLNEGRKRNENHNDILESRGFQIARRLDLESLAIWASNVVQSILPACLQKLVGELFYFGEGNLVGSLVGILWDFSDPQNQGSKISGKISEHFS